MARVPHTALSPPMSTHSLRSAQVCPAPGSLPYLSLCFHRTLSIPPSQCTYHIIFYLFLCLPPLGDFNLSTVSLWCYARKGSCSLNILLSHYIYNHPAHTSHPFFIVRVRDHALLRQQRDRALAFRLLL